MPAPILGQQVSIADTWVEVYELGSLPAYSYGIASLWLNNTGAADSTVRIAVGQVGTNNDPVGKDLVEYDIVISGEGVHELNNVVIKTGESVFIYSNTATVEARVHGLLFNTTTNFVQVAQFESTDVNENIIMTADNATNAVFGTYNIYMTNSGASTMNVSIKVGVTGQHRNIETTMDLAPNESYERTCLFLSPSEEITVQTDVATGLSTRISGIVKVPDPS